MGIALFGTIVGVVVLLIGLQQASSCSSLQAHFRECSGVLGYSMEVGGGVLVAGGIAVLAAVSVSSKKP